MSIAAQKCAASASIPRMIGVERYRRILDLINAEEILRVDDIAVRLGVSSSTIRRDLAHLERAGRLVRVHGGATTPQSVQEEAEEPRIMRAAEHRAEKRRIGETAAGLVADGDTIVIGGGTTTEAMVPFLRGRERLTVVTNSVSVLLRAGQLPGTSVIALGGYLHRGESLLLNRLALEALQGLTIDRVFYGAYAIGPEGLMGGDVAEAETDRMLIASASELVVLADGSKFGLRGPICLAAADKISTLVTDLSAPESHVVNMKTFGVNVIQS